MSKKSLFDSTKKSVRVWKKLEYIFERAKKEPMVDEDNLVSQVVKGSWSERGARNPQKLERRVKDTKIVFQADVSNGNEVQFLSKLGNGGMVLMPVSFLIKHLDPQKWVCASDDIYFTTKSDLMDDTLFSFRERTCFRCGARNMGVISDDLTVQEKSTGVCKTCFEEISKEDAKWKEEEDTTTTHKRKINDNFSCIAGREETKEDSEETESEEFEPSLKKNRGTPSLVVP
jgi:hypothetical protein